MYIDANIGEIPIKYILFQSKITLPEYLVLSFLFLSAITLRINLFFSSLLLLISERAFAY